jgi:lipid-A-disaccharide synthase
LEKLPIENDTLLPVEVVLVTNGPGELYTWTHPVLRALREADKNIKITISLVPDQFTSGNETAIAQSFNADAVTTPKEFLTYIATGRKPDALGDDKGVVIGLGGSIGMALQLASRLNYPAYRYSFNPDFNRGLKKLFVHDERTFRRARLMGAPKERLELVGNLVADAVQQSSRLENPGNPHVLLLAGTRDTFSVVLIPFIIGLADVLGKELPNAKFAWPVSRLLRPETIEAGIEGLEKDVLGGMAGRREGDTIFTPSGTAIHMISEAERYAHIRAADIAVTIPGTNTLELGIAGVPSVVMLPMNKPEVIPLEGIGQWLGLIPGVGTFIKRRAVKLFVEGLKLPVSLPNRLSGEDLMLEIKGKISVEQIAEAMLSLLKNSDDLSRRRERLLQTMPQAGAAKKLVESVLADVERAKTEGSSSPLA